MLKTLSDIQIKASKLHLKVIKSSIALVLSLMFRIGSVTVVSQNSRELKNQLVKLKEKKTDAVKTMHDFLNTWIRRVVGSVFGGISSWGKTIPIRLERETKVCDSYLLFSHIEMCTFADLIL